MSIEGSITTQTTVTTTTETQETTQTQGATFGERPINVPENPPSIQQPNTHTNETALTDHSHSVASTPQQRPNSSVANSVPLRGSNFNAKVKQAFSKATLKTTSEVSAKVDPGISSAYLTAEQKSQPCPAGRVSTRRCPDRWRCRAPSPLLSCSWQPPSSAFSSAG